MAKGDTSYNLLLEHLHSQEFSWFIPNDDNRAYEGKNLREKYCNEIGIDYHCEDFDYECTMLELIIGLAYRCESMLVDRRDSLSVREWFWKLITNIGLEDCSDDVYYNMGAVDYIEVVIDRIISRTYQRSGNSGLFPLKKSKKDQRKVELWYQMSEYLVENYYT